MASSAVATGYDRQDYSESIALLNEICGTRARFKTWQYDGDVAASKQFDLVFSLAVLVHLSEPLRHLAWLGSAASRALFVMTPVHDGDDMTIRFHTVNRYYEEARFPFCFDVVTISRRLLRTALERMGFSKLIELDTSTMPTGWQHMHPAILALRG